MSDIFEVEVEALRAVTRRILEAGGSSTEEAEIVADHLILANQSGHDSHGVGMLPAYVRDLRKNLLVPDQAPDLVLDGGAILIFDGRRGYGQSIGKRVMETAIERCRQHGIALATLRNTHHLGRIGTYGEQAVAAGLCSIHFVNVTDHGPLVAPFRGSDARFSTNPVCLAMPGTERQPPILLDMATSRIAAGKVRVAHNKGEPLPPGSVIDAEGSPTTDADIFHRRPPGSLVPFGEHKGYGLALFSDLFGGLLSGGGTLQPENPRLGSIINNMLTIVFDPARLVEDAWRQHEIEALVEHVKGSPAARAEEPVLVPGDPERIAREERAETLPVDSETLDQIVAAAESLGMEGRALRARMMNAEC